VALLASLGNIRFISCN